MEKDIFWRHCGCSRKRDYLSFGLSICFCLDRFSCRLGLSFYLDFVSLLCWILVFIIVRRMRKRSAVTVVRFLNIFIFLGREMAMICASFKE